MNLMKSASRFLKKNGGTILAIGASVGVVLTAIETGKASMDDEDHLRAACWNLLWALNQRVTHPELDDRFAVKREDGKKSHQVLCPNCLATIIKENGQICDGVPWRVCVPNEKIKLKCCYCNRAVIVSIKDIVDERLKGETDE